MKLQKAVKTLKKHNEWRRGERDKEIKPEKVGIAIDTVVNHFRENYAYIDTSIRFGDEISSRDS